MTRFIVLPELNSEWAYSRGELMDLYNEFLKLTEFPEKSADELWHEIDDPSCRKWLIRFIDLWHEMENMEAEDEKEWMEYATRYRG